MLKGSQRKYLRGVAHGLKPLVQVGKEGVSVSVLDAIDRALVAHELIKIQIMADREDRQTMIGDIERGASCECAGAIGKMAIFYRRQTDPEKRKINLPS
ncbi:MAG: YhbY family RNA-binding protein [Thermoanaerobaculales bacterium]|nr:YhbY family RNA-binding protein [Thermoanaerobaculales bacterium]